MAEKNLQSIDLDGDVQIIREILFGKQLQGLKEQLDAQGKKLSSLERSLSNLRNRVNAEVAARGGDTKTLEDTLKKTERQILSQIEEMNKALEAQINSGNEAQRELSRNIAEKLTVHQMEFSTLINDLVSLINNYQENPPSETD